MWETLSEPRIAKGIQRRGRVVLQLPSRRSHPKFDSSNRCSISMKLYCFFHYNIYLSDKLLILFCAIVEARDNLIHTRATRLAKVCMLIFFSLQLTLQSNAEILWMWASAQFQYRLNSSIYMLDGSDRHLYTSSCHRIELIDLYMKSEKPNFNQQ